MASIDFTIDQNAIRKFICGFIYKLKMEMLIKDTS